jgi:acetolactate synthase small subunit
MYNIKSYIKQFSNLIFDINRDSEKFILTEDSHKLENKILLIREEDKDR